MIIYLLKYCYGLNFCPHPQNSYIEMLTSNVMVLGGGGPSRGDDVMRVEPS